MRSEGLGLVLDGLRIGGAQPARRLGLPSPHKAAARPPTTNGRAEVRQSLEVPPATVVRSHDERAAREVVAPLGPCVGRCLRTP